MNIEQVSGLDDLFSDLVNCLDLDDLPTKVGWAGAADYVWQATMARPDRSVVLLVKNAMVLAERNLQAFVDFMEFLGELRKSLESEKETSWSHPVLFRVIILGKGTCFPPWA